MHALMNLNDFLYHSTEVLLCDIKLAFLNARIARRNKQIASLEVQLKAFA